MSGKREPRKVDWDTFSTEISEKELEEASTAVGFLMISFSLLEIHFAKTLSAALGVSRVIIGDALAANVDATHKERLLRGVSGIFKNAGAVDQAAMTRRLCTLFLELLEERNVVAHGTLGKCEGRMLIGSVQASARLRPSGGTEKWVYFDEIPHWHKRCREALNLTRDLQPIFKTAWDRSLGGDNP